MSDTNSSDSQNKSVILAFKSEWVFWLVVFDMQQLQYQIEEICAANTVETFFSLYSELPQVSELKNYNYKKISIGLFRAGIKPAWEDPNNKNGGVFSFLVKLDPVVRGADRKRLDINEVWRNLMMMTVGGDLKKYLKECSNPTEANDNKENKKNEENKDDNKEDESNVCGIIIGPKKNDCFGLDIWVQKDIENSKIQESFYTRVINTLDINNYVDKKRYTKNNNG